MGFPYRPLGLLLWEGSVPLLDAYELVHDPLIEVKIIGMKTATKKDGTQYKKVLVWKKQAGGAKPTWINLDNMQKHAASLMDPPEGTTDEYPPIGDIDDPSSADPQLEPMPGQDKVPEMGVEGGAAWIPSNKLKMLAKKLKEMGVEPQDTFQKAVAAGEPVPTEMPEPVGADNLPKAEPKPDEEPPPEDEKPPEEPPADEPAPDEPAEPEEPAEPPAEPGEEPSPEEPPPEEPAEPEKPADDPWGLSPDGDPDAPLEPGEEPAAEPETPEPLKAKPVYWNPAVKPSYFTQDEALQLQDEAGLQPNQFVHPKTKEVYEVDLKEGQWIDPTTGAVYEMKNGKPVKVATQATPTGISEDELVPSDKSLEEIGVPPPPTPPSDEEVFGAFQNGDWEKLKELAPSMTESQESQAIDIVSAAFNDEMSAEYVGKALELAKILAERATAAGQTGAAAYYTSQATALEIKLGKEPEVPHPSDEEVAAANGDPEELAKLGTLSKAQIKSLVNTAPLNLPIDNMNAEEVNQCLKLLEILSDSAATSAPEWVSVLDEAMTENFLQKQAELSDPIEEAPKVAPGYEGFDEALAKGDWAALKANVAELSPEQQTTLAGMVVDTGEAHALTTDQLKDAVKAASLLGQAMATSGDPAAAASYAQKASNLVKILTSKVQAAKETEAQKKANKPTAKQVKSAIKKKDIKWLTENAAELTGKQKVIIQKAVDELHGTQNWDEAIELANVLIKAHEESPTTTSPKKIKELKKFVKQAQAEKDVAVTPSAAAVEDLPPAAPGVPEEPVATPSKKAVEKIKPPAGIPKPEELSLVGSGNFLGGAGDKRIYVDKDGNKWLFKVAQTKGGSQSKPFAAAVQQAYAEIAQIVHGGEYPVPVGVMTLGGKLGTLQPMVDRDPKQPDLGHASVESLSDEDRQTLAREHLLDWLGSQHDSHGGQFIRAANGQIIGVDKEQGFRFFPGDTLSLDYDPNHVGQPPIYNSLWKGWVEGKYDMDPMDMLEGLQAIENMSTKDYIAKLRPYAEALYPGKPEEQAKFLKAARKRKLDLRKDFEAFFTKLYRQKTGSKDGTFTFDTGWSEDTGKVSKKAPKTVKKTYKSTALMAKVAAAAGTTIKTAPYQDPATGTPQPEAGKITIKVQNGGGPAAIEKVKKMFEQLGINPDNLDDPIVGSYYTNFVVDKNAWEAASVTVDEVVSPPSPTGDAKSTPDRPRYFPDDTENIPATDNNQDLATVGSTTLGAGGRRYASDGAGLTGSGMRVTRRKDAQGTYQQISFRIRPQALPKKLVLPDTSEFVFPKASFDSSDDSWADESGHSSSYNMGRIPTRSLQTEVGEIHMCTSSTHFAYKDHVIIKLRPRPGQTEDDALRELLDTAQPGLADELLRNPKPAEKQALKQRRLLWASAPQVADLVDGKVDPNKSGVLSRLKQQLKPTAAEKAAIATADTPAIGWMKVALRRMGVTDDVLDKATTPTKVKKLMAKHSKNPKMLQKLLESTGMTPEQASGENVEEVEAFPGHTTGVEKGRGKRLREKGVRFVFHGADPNLIVSMLQNGPMGIGERDARGIPRGIGVSETADVGTGSGDNVLGYMMTESGLGHSLNSHSFAKECQLIVSTDELDRLDSYLHFGDHYGCTNPGSSSHGPVYQARDTIDRAAERQASSYHSSHEIGFRRGIRQQQILRVTTQSEHKRAAMIKKLKEAGMHEVNGVPVEDFVVVANNAGEVYEKYVQPTEVD